jgi:putative glutathione S-transferase
MAPSCDQIPNFDPPSPLNQEPLFLLKLAVTISMYLMHALGVCICSLHCKSSLMIIAHRTLIVRRLKGLEDIISVTSVHHLMSLTTGWRFPTAEEHEPGELCGPDPLHDDVKEMRDLYFRANSNYKGRYTVPVLWDKKTETIVNNESSEIIRMLNTEFNSLLAEKFREVDLYSRNLQPQIDELHQWIYHDINNGV